MADVTSAYLAASADRLGARQAAAHLKPVVAALGWLKVATLKQPHVRAYANRRLDSTKAPSGTHGSVRPGTVGPGTVREELSKLRAALRWAAGEGLCPLVEFKIPISGEPRARWLTREECEALLAGAREPHVRLGLLILLHTAARPSAALELTWDRVDFTRGVVDLGIKQGGKGRAMVPMTRRLRAALQEAREAATTPYVVEYGGRRVSTMRTGWRNALRRAGIPHCTRHDLRRTAATLMLIGGVPLEKVSRFLGHKSVTVTARVYAKHTIDWLEDAADVLEARR